MKNHDPCLRALFRCFLEKLGNMEKEDFLAIVREHYPGEEAFEKFADYFESAEGMDRLTIIVSEEARKIRIH